MTGAERGQNLVHGNVSGQLLQAGAVFGSVHQTTNVVAAPAPVAALASLVVPAARPGHRTRGRSELVSAAVDAVRTSSVVVLHGAGGHGKTTVAVDVAVAAGRDVWWVDAGTEASLTAGLQAVAVAAGANPERVRDAWTRGVGAAPELLWDTLNARTTDWLLVLDNADDPDLLTAGQGRVHERRGWLRTPGGRGAVLVTTRSAGPRPWGDAVLLPVGPLSPADGAAVLRDLAPNAGPDATDLSTRLGGLPLALYLAGSYLAAAETFLDLPGPAAPTTFAGYLDAWEERLVELSDQSWDVGPAPERELLTRTWELSLDLLVRRGHPLGRPLLRTLACLGRGPVPTVLLDAAVLAGSPLFTGLTPAALNGAVQALREVGLVEPGRTGAIGTVGLHPVVRDINRHQAMVDDMIRITALSALASAVDRLRPDDVTAWPLWRLLVDHTDLAVDLATDRAAPGYVRAAAATVCHDTALFCETAGLDLRSLELNRVALECGTEVLGPAEERVLATKHNMAHVLGKLGHHTAAVTAIREVLAAEAAARGEAHEETLVTRCKLAEILREQGDLTTAEAEFRTVVRLVGESPVTTGWNARTGLAVTLRERGQFAESAAILRADLARARHELGDGHTHTIRVSSALVDVLHEQGRAAEAAPLATAAAAASAALLGPEHEQTLGLRTRVVAGMVAEGDRADAAAELRDVLAVVERTKGPDHPFAFDVRRSLAVLAEETGDVTAAEEAYRGLLADETRVHGPDGVRWRTRLGLAATMLERGDRDGAERTFRETLAAREGVGAAGLPEIQIRLRLAKCLLLRGDLAAAETESRTALDHALASVGPDHREAAQAYSHLGEVLVAKGEHAAGVRLLAKAHAVTVAEHGPEHVSSLVSRANLAAGHLSGAAALAEYRDILAVARRTGTLDHPSLLMVRHNFAAAAMDAGELAEAEQVLRAVLPVAEARTGGGLGVVRLRLRLGQVLSRVDDHTGAEALLTEVVSDLERMRLGESEEARTARHVLAMTALRRGDLATAETRSRAALALGRRVTGPRDRLTLESQLVLVVALYSAGRGPRADAEARDLLEKARDHQDITATVRLIMHGER